MERRNLPLPSAPAAGDSARDYTRGPARRQSGGESSDLTQLEGGLSTANFTALSSGIGIGQPRPRREAGTTAPVAVERGSPAAYSPAQAAARARASHGANPANPRPEAFSGPRPDAPVPRSARPPRAPSVRLGSQASAAVKARSGLSRKLCAWGLDFAFVVTALTTSVVTAAGISAVKHGDTDFMSHPTVLKPVAWLLAQLSSSPYVLLAGIYGLFFAYVLLFKLLAGRTFGEVMLKVPTKLSERAAQNRESLGA